MQLDSACAQQPGGEWSLSLQGQLGPGLEPRPCLMQSDFSDTEWILHPLLWERLAEVKSSTSYSHLSLKLMCAFFVWLWTAEQTKERLLPSGIQITLTTVIYVAADWWFLLFELPSAASFPAWMNEVIKHSNYKSHWLPCIQGRVPPKPCCEACYPGDCPVQSKTELFWPSELVGGENISDADLLPQHSKCIFLISQQGNAAIQQGHYIWVFFWGMTYISLTTAGSLNMQKGSLGQQW